MCEEEDSKMGSWSWSMASCWQEGPSVVAGRARIVSGMLQLLTFIGGDLGYPAGVKYSAGNIWSIEKQAHGDNGSDGSRWTPFMNWRKTMKDSIFHQLHASVKGRTSWAADYKRISSPTAEDKKAEAQARTPVKRTTEFQRKVSSPTQQTCCDRPGPCLGESGTLRLWMGHLSWCTEKSWTPRLAGGLQNGLLLLGLFT